MPKNPTDNNTPSPKDAPRRTGNSRRKLNAQSPRAGAEQATVNEKKALESGEESPV